MIVTGLLRAAVIVALSADISVAQVVSQGVSGTPGPAVGAKAPAFQLSDQTGVSRSLEAVIGPKGLMLVFFRSADW
jgi:hypothetical protein